MNSFKNKLIVHGLIRINQKYLVIKRTMIKRGKPNVYPEFWDIPGGSVEDYEKPRDALIREFKEEVGLNVAVDSIIHEDSQYDDYKNIMFTRLVYTCSLKIQERFIQIILDPQEHTQYRFISSLDELANEKVVPYLSDILSHQQ